MDISVAIVSYNTAKVIRETIESILKQQDVTYEIIIIDNNSPDNSREVIQAYAEQATLIFSHENLGSGGGANQAFKLAKGRYFYILNPDAVLTTPHDLAHLVKFMDAHPEYGGVGTRMLEDNGKTEVLPRRYYPYQQHIRTDLSSLPGDIAWVVGASFVIRRDAFERTEGFAQEYFLYGDEVDLCFRIRQLGYEIGYTDIVSVNHIGGASEHNTRAYDYWLKKQTGLHTFIQKHYGKQDVVAILKKDKFRAGYRKNLLRIKQRVCRLSPKQQAKFERYSAIYDSSVKLLAEVK